MRIKAIKVVLRKDGFFHDGAEKIKAYYKGDGYGVMVELEPSPIDKDFATYIWVPSEPELEEIRRKMDESDEKTHELLGRGWGGRRPFHKLEDYM